MDKNDVLNIIAVILLLFVALFDWSWNSLLMLAGIIILIVFWVEERKEKKIKIKS